MMKTGLGEKFKEAMHINRMKPPLNRDVSQEHQPSDTPVVTSDAGRPKY